MDNKEKIIKDAQYRKGLSIAFFNANNLAITLVSTDKEYYTKEELKKEIVGWRDFFLEEHKNYYANVISPVGCLFDKNQTLEVIKSAISLEDLKEIWISLSEDERQDSDIVSAKNEIKEKYEKTK